MKLLVDHVPMNSKPIVITFQERKGTRKYAGHKYAKENEEGKFKCRNDLIKCYEPYTRLARNHQFFLTKRKHVREEYADGSCTT